MNAFWPTALGVLTGVAVLGAQTPGGTRSQADPAFRVQIELVTLDAIARDATGQFVADLTKDEIEVYEDGVRQNLSSMTLVRAGRVTNLLAPPPPPAPEGVILPARRVQNDLAGRIFVFFVDDLHLPAYKTPHVRLLLQQMAKTLLHEGDMWAMVSTGLSSIAIDVTYDRARFDEAVRKVIGSELSPTEIIDAPPGAKGPVEVRHRAHVAFTTASELVQNLEKIHDRRKALVYVSDGYDFIPFQDARLNPDPSSPFAKNSGAALATVLGAQSASPDGTPSASQMRPDPNRGAAGEGFADADLARELADLTRAANRANATIYTVDPRGAANPLGDIGDNIDQRAWMQFVSKTQDTLRVLAAETGGIAILNQNDIDDALKRIDAETSDYYVVGYYSKNPAPSKRGRQLEVKVNRDGVSVWARTGIR